MAASRWGFRTLAAWLVLSGLALPVGPTVSSSRASVGLTSVRSFLYQLQDIDLSTIGDSCYDLIVIDYSSDGSEEGEFTSSEIEALADSPGGAKIVLSYMSIGEAEDYRFYWQAGWEPGDPSWLDEENPNWPGNYKVHYWEAEWQGIILEYADRLIDAGFHGAYLDLVDAYEHYESQGRPTAAEEMVAFVDAIRAHTAIRDPDFLILVQNAAELVDSFPGYLATVDGIGQEDIYYGYLGDDVMTPLAVTSEMESHLGVFLASGDVVLTIDYATTPAHIDDAYAKSQSKGYIPFVTVRNLDELTVNPGHDPCAEASAAVFRVDADGRAFSDATVHAASLQVGAADVAEWVTVSAVAEAGDVLEHDPFRPGGYRVTRLPCSELVAGVVSTEPGIVLGASGPRPEKAPIALIGIVPVRVTAEGGSIKPGDLLVSSSAPGHAMRWSGPDPCPCALVGKALEPMTTDRGLIRVLRTAH